jgi:hypothetical protein
MNLKQLRKEIRKEILSIDPVAWVEENCTIDGDPFKIRGDGHRNYLVDIYRQIGINALKPNGKPIVIYKGRQVEMSTTAIALDAYFAASGIFGTPTPEEIEAGTARKLPRIKVFHVFPQDKQTDRFIKEKVTPFFNSMRGDIMNKMKGAVDTDRIKQFKGDNSLFFESTGVNGDRLRNLSGDIVFFDEFQDFYRDAISNTRMLLKRARHGPRGNGVQVFFGTPKEKDSFFSETWEKSTKQYYNLKCERCDAYFPMFMPYNDSWKEIWLWGNLIKCPFCGQKQDKIKAVANGKWIETAPDAPFIGFHLNLFTHPDFTKETILKERPEENPLMTERKFQNEILGQFFSGGGITITPQDIVDNCADLDREISTVGVPNIPTYLGLDWGKKVEGQEGGSSFSVAVIIEVHGEVVKIINAFRLKTREFYRKIEVVEEIFKRYNVRQSVSDLGYGEELFSELQKKFMSRILGWYNNTKIQTPYKYRKGDHYIFANKDVMIEQVFDMVRNGKIRFPFATETYENIEFLIRDCCSMEVKKRVMREQEFNSYVKGSAPNDGLMSLCYAILAHKFVISKGFTLTSNVMKIKQFQTKSPVPALVGYVPRMK